MKIATFNINNINARLDNLIDWLDQAQPDVVCLQELKAEQGAFPAETLEQLGYGAVWKGQRTWNGVAILARDAQPVLTRSSLPGDPADDQARYIEAAVNGVLVASIYLPNGNPRPGPKFDYKLAWFARLIAHAEALKASGAPVVLAGDYNVVPTEADIYPNHSWKDDALLQPESRAAYQRAARRGLDRRPANDPSGRAALDLLGLQAPALAARQGPAAGPSAADTRPRRTTRRRRRRSLDARRGARQRPRAGLDRAGPLKRWERLERAGGIEPPTFCLGSRRSTSELRPRGVGRSLAGQPAHLKSASERSGLIQPRRHPEQRRVPVDGHLVLGEGAVVVDPAGLGRALALHVLGHRIAHAGRVGAARQHAGGGAG
jgi:exodeoxyribonuclease-3